jgi:hypothetical protein
MPRFGPQLLWVSCFVSAFKPKNGSAEAARDNTGRFSETDPGTARAAGGRLKPLPVFPTRRRTGTPDSRRPRHPGPQLGRRVCARRLMTLYREQKDMQKVQELSNELARNTVEPTCGAKG